MSESDALAVLQDLCESNQFRGTVSRESIHLTPFFVMSRNSAPPVFRGRVVSTSPAGGTYIELRAEFHRLEVAFALCWLVIVAPLAFRFHERGLDFPVLGLWFLLVLPGALLGIFLWESSVAAQRIRRAAQAVQT